MTLMALYAIADRFALPPEAVAMLEGLFERSPTSGPCSVLARASRSSDMNRQENTFYSTLSLPEPQQEPALEAGEDAETIYVSHLPVPPDQAHAQPSGIGAAPGQLSTTTLGHSDAPTVPGGPIHHPGSPGNNRVRPGSMPPADTLPDRAARTPSSLPPIAEVSPTGTGTHHPLVGGLDRYTWQQKLGEGQMGTVWRVLDRDLGRTVALKVARPEVMAQPATLARFIEEAQVCGQLQHPHIIPVHELGRLGDGRFYFTMQEIRGRSFDRVMRAVSQVREHGGHATADGWSFRRLMEAFHQVCQAVGHAHSRGVIHRDLKPTNIMVGSPGQVLVVDWGLAKVRGLPDRALEAGKLKPIRTTRSTNDAQATQLGMVAGTPAYMPPEQALGLIDLVDARSDVYALGAILYQLLTGRAPFRGPSMAVLMEVRESGPAPIEETELVPEELVGLCEQAMARTPADRFRDGNALAAAVGAWLEGARKRERALEDVTAAATAETEATRQRTRASALRAKGSALLKGVDPWESETAKAPGWALQDEGAAIVRAAGLSSLRAEQLLHAALSHAPDLPEAHAALAKRYRKAHGMAEDSRDEARATRLDVLLRTHARALPTSHPERRAHLAYLKGDGAVSLVTEPAGATVLLERYVLQNRRLVATRVRSLGRTPLHEQRLPMGSYQLRIQAEGWQEICYPLCLGREEHWDGIAPGDTSPTPIPLLPRGSLGPEDCYVPAGWFWSGGDPRATNSLPRRRLWVDGLLMRRFPVTNREYIAFLDALVAAGREPEALRCVPQERSGQAGQHGSIIYHRQPDGRFTLGPDGDGDLWRADAPVCMVDWHSAQAFAAYERGRTGEDWRLPGDLEWEKCARGVDGRFYPWGDHLDPSWSCVRTSHPGRRQPAAVDSFPVDQSVYGIRGMAGNMMDWCADRFSAEGPPTRLGRVIPPRIPDPGQTEPDTGRVDRGGSWVINPRYARLAFRGSVSSSSRGNFLGFRLARSLG